MNSTYVKTWDKIMKRVLSFTKLWEGVAMMMTTWGRPFRAFSLSGRSAGSKSCDEGEKHKMTLLQLKSVESLKVKQSKGLTTFLRWKVSNEAKVFLLRVTSSDLPTLTTRLEVRLKKRSKKLTVLINSLYIKKDGSYKELGSTLGLLSLSDNLNLNQRTSMSFTKSKTAYKNKRVTRGEENCPDMRWISWFLGHLPRQESMDQFRITNLRWENKGSQVKEIEGPIT